jgi:hypothetical protein
MAENKQSADQAEENIIEETPDTELLKQIGEAEAIGEQEFIMNLLVKAIEKANKYAESRKDNLLSKSNKQKSPSQSDKVYPPSRAQIIEVLKKTPDVPIPQIVREHIILCLDTKNATLMGKVGKQPPGDLDHLGRKAKDVFLPAADGKDFTSRRDFLRHEYDRIRKQRDNSKPISQAMAIDIIADKYRHLFFDDPARIPTRETVLKAIFGKRRSMFGGATFFL